MALRVTIRTLRFKATHVSLSKKQTIVLRLGEIQILILSHTGHYHF